MTFFPLKNFLKYSYANIHQRNSLFPSFNPKATALFSSSCSNSGNECKNTKPKCNVSPICCGPPLRHRPAKFHSSTACELGKDCNNPEAKKCQGFCSYCPPQRSYEGVCPAAG